MVKRFSERKRIRPKIKTIMLATCIRIFDENCRNWSNREPETNCITIQETAEHAKKTPTSITYYDSIGGIIERKNDGEFDKQKLLHR